MKVLVVDDEPLIVKMLARFARTSGYEPTIAKDGLEAWELFSQSPGDWTLIITDIKMPRLDGISFVEKVRDSGSHLPVVFISGHGQIPDTDALSPATFLPKPFLRAELMDAIRDSTPAH